MSHDHRDDKQLAQLDRAEAEAVVVAPAPPVVANSEAERRAAERRKLEGVGEQTLQHEFTGDLGEPDRGGTDIETRLVFTDADDADGDPSAARAAAARRGPPAPRFAQVEAAVSWAQPPLLFGATLPAAETAWSRDGSFALATFTHTGGSWGR